MTDTHLTTNPSAENGLSRRSLLLKGAAASAAIAMAGAGKALGAVAVESGDATPFDPAAFVREMEERFGDRWEARYSSARQKWSLSRTEGDKEIDDMERYLALLQWRRSDRRHSAALVDYLIATGRILPA